MTPFGEGYDGSAVTVPVWRLDDVLRAESLAIDVLKIDVEGSEYDVILGATRTLRRCRYVLLELGLKRDSSRRNLELLSYIKHVVPSAPIVRFGRPLGGHEPLCQDVLLRLSGEPGRQRVP